MERREMLKLKEKAEHWARMKSFFLLKWISKIEKWGLKSDTSVVCAERCWCVLCHTLNISCAVFLPKDTLMDSFGLNQATLIRSLLTADQQFFFVFWEWGELCVLRCDHLWRRRDVRVSKKLLMWLSKWGHLGSLPHLVEKLFLQLFLVYDVTAEVNISKDYNKSEMNGTLHRHHMEVTFQNRTHFPSPDRNKRSPQQWIDGVGWDSGLKTEAG